MSTAPTACRQTLAGLRVLLLLTVVAGAVYPALVLGVAQLVPGRAGGSLLTGPDGAVVGSALLAQESAGPQWFHPRPSAAGDGYDATASEASNLGASSPELLEAVAQRRDAVAREEGVDPADVPADAVTASASGLDPHISPEYAALQAERVARENDLDLGQVQALVAEQTAGRELGFLGQPRVAVLELNLAVAAAAGTTG